MKCRNRKFASGHWAMVTVMICWLSAVVAPVPAAAMETDTDASAQGDRITGVASKSYRGEYKGWVDPCPDGVWENPTSGIGASINIGEKNLAISIERNGIIPDLDFDFDDGARDATGIGIIDETVEFGGGEYTVWVNEGCPNGTEVSFVPERAEQLLPDFLGLAEDYLPEPELTLKPFDPDQGWTYVNVPIDFRTTPETVEPVVVTVVSDGPDPAWVTITATPITLTYRSGDPQAEGAQVEKSCDVDPNATAPYNPDVPGECSYQYINASSIADGNVFEAELELQWDVRYESSDGPGVLTVDPTVQEEEVAVAEVKAVNVYDE